MSQPGSPTSPKKERRQSVRFAERSPTIIDDFRQQHNASNGDSSAIFDVGDDEDDDAWGHATAGKRANGSAAQGSGSSGAARSLARGGAQNARQDAYELEENGMNGQAGPADEDMTGSSTRRAYGLKSTQSSREAEFDADDSDVEADELLAMDTSGAVHAQNGLDKAVHGRAGTAAVQRSSRQQNGGMHRHDDSDASSHGAFAVLGRARRSISEGAIAGVDLRESLRSAMESEDLPDWLRKGAGILDSTWNMSNSILGAGVVGLPYSMKESGCLTGILLILGIALMTDWTIRLIVLNAKLSGRGTYIDIMDYCFGRQGRIAVSIFQGTFAFGGMCAFIVVIGDTFPHVLTSLIPALEGSFLASRGLIMVVATLSISFPLSLYRSIESLSRASAIALVSMVLIIITVTVRGPAMPEELKGDPSLRFTIIHPTNVVRSIAVISFAFVCHHNSLLIYGSLKEPSMDRFGKVTHYSTAISAAALVAMSLAGYWTFTDKTLGNVLNNFPPDDTMVNIARFCFGMNMLTTWPLELFVAREVIETYFFEGQYDKQRHVVTTVALTVGSLVVSLLATDLGVVLEVTGGLSATALAFIFPSVCYLKLCGQGDNASSQNASREHAGGDGGQGYRGISGADEDEEEREADAELHREVRGDISADDVELPLRPGAQLRRRGTASLSGKSTPWYLTTKPLAVMVTAFGCFVMVVSTFTTLRAALFGSGEEDVPAHIKVPGSAAAVGSEPAENATTTLTPPASNTTAIDEAVADAVHAAATLAATGAAEGAQALRRWIQAR